MMRRVLRTPARHLPHMCTRVIPCASVMRLNTARQVWASQRFSSVAQPSSSTPSSSPEPRPSPLSSNLTSTSPPSSPSTSSSTTTSSSSAPPPSRPTQPSSSSPPPPPPSSPTPPSPSSPPRGPVSWRSFAVMALTGTLLLAYYNYERARQQTQFQPVVTIGRAALGGPFSLISSTGQPVTSQSLRGQYLLLYFGFTHCPDICPTELRKMEHALSLYSSTPSAPPIQPLFITIDPQRDTTQRLTDYQRQYSPSFMFLTGSVEQIKDVAKSYRVYYSAPEGEGDDYLVDHSIFFYLLDRDGEVMDYFGKNFTAEEIARKMHQIITQDNTKQPAK